MRASTKSMTLTAFAFALALAGCAGEAPGAGPRRADLAGSAVIALSSVPPAVRCIRVTAEQGATSVTVSQGLGGATEATVAVNGLPLGAVVFSAVAFNRGCATVDASTPVTWRSDRVPAELRVDRVPSVAMTLFPIRATEVQADFQPDFVEADQCGLALLARDSAGAVYGAGITEIVEPAIALPASTPKIACEGYHACALSAAGAVTCWGTNELLRAFDSTELVVTTPVSPGAFQATDVFVGLGVACAALVDGSLTCWGANDNGIIVPATPSVGYVGPTAPPGVIVDTLYSHTDVVFGSTHACARRNEGAVVCWGNNDSVQLGGLTAVGSNEVYGVSGVVDIDAGGYKTYALRGDGRVYQWGDGSEPALVAGLDDAVEIAAGSRAACALRQNGEVACWGSNSLGALGDGSGEDRSEPTVPVDFSGAFDGPVPAIMGITAAHDTMCALHVDGSLSCWGYNITKQLADGTVFNSYVPLRAERWDARYPWPQGIGSSSGE